MSLAGVLLSWASFVCGVYWSRWNGDAWVVLPFVGQILAMVCIGAVAGLSDEERQMKIADCYIKMRPGMAGIRYGDPNGSALFEFPPASPDLCAVNLTGYVVVPMEDYTILAVLKYRIGKSAIAKWLPRWLV